MNLLVIPCGDGHHRCHSRIGSLLSSIINKYCWNENKKCLLWYWLSSGRTSDLSRSDCQLFFATQKEKHPSMVRHCFFLLTTCMSCMDAWVRDWELAQKIYQVKVLHQRGSRSKIRQDVHQSNENIRLLFHQRCAIELCCDMKLS